MGNKISVSATRDITNLNSRTFEERMQELGAIEEKTRESLKREKQSAFSRWTQYNLDHTQKIMWLQLKHPKAAAILSFLVDQMDEYNAVMCSYKLLEEVLDVGHATIARNIKVLKDNGYIAILKSGTSNVYAINDTVYWKSWGNNRRYSKFPANVILTLSEQEENYRKKLEMTKHKEIELKT